MGLFRNLGRFLGGATGVSGLGPMGENPANVAMPYLNQISGVGKQYYDPYISEGRNASNISNPIYERMASDPTEFINALMRGYKPSEGYRYKEDRLGRAISNTAAAGGFRGTPFEQEQQGQMISGLLGEDMQQFLQNILGVQGAGLQGEENRIGRGFQASGNLADYIGSNLGQQAGLAYQGQAGQNAYNLANRLSKNKARGSLLGKIAGGAANFIMPGAGSSMSGMGG